MGRPKKPHEPMRIQVFYELATEEKRKETIAFFASLCAQYSRSTADDRTEGNWLPHGFFQENKKRREERRFLKWLPFWNGEGNKPAIERRFRPTELVPPTPGGPIGAMLRFFRRRRGLTIMELARRAGVSHNVISRTERDKGPHNIVMLGRLLDFFSQEFKEFLPTVSEIVDRVIEPKTFGGWLRNFRMRRGLQQKELAESLGVSNVCISRYERSVVRPGDWFLDRLKNTYQLGPEVDRFQSKTGKCERTLPRVIRNKGQE